MRAICFCFGLKLHAHRAAPNYKNSHPMVITLRLFLHPDKTLGERIKKLRLEQGLFQVDLARMIGVNEITIVNWKKGRTRCRRFYGVSWTLLPSISMLVLE